MPTIRTISDLRSKTSEIERLCIQERRTVLITKNGTGHLVVMSRSEYDRQQFLLALHEKLGEAEAQSCQGRCKPFRKVMSNIKRRLHDKAQNACFDGGRGGWKGLR